MSSNSPTLPEEYVPIPARISISLGDAACAILQSFVAAGALTFYFTKIQGLDLKLAGAVWLLFGIWNAVNDPLFGWISDRTKTSLGRRIPYIRYGAPIFILSFILFWVNLPGSANNQTVLFLQLLLVLFLFDSLYTAIATSLYIMPYEIAVSNKARSSIYIWKILFMVFTIVGPQAIEATLKPQSAADVEAVRIFRLAMMGIGVVLGAIIFFSTFFYKENSFAQKEEQYPFIKSLVECFKNRSFLVFEAISFAIMFAQTALMTGLWYYFDEIDVSRTPLYLALGAGIILGIVLWISTRDRLGVKRGVQAMALCFVIGCFTILFMGRLLAPASVGFFFFGLAFAGGMYLIPLMNGDVVDMDEHLTGLRREGMYAGINSLVTKPAISIAQAVLLNVFAWYGYDQSLAKGLQSTQAETGILVGWTLATGILMLAGFFILQLYPLHGPAWEQIKVRLAAVHAEKERQILAEKGFQYAEKPV